MKAPPWKKLPAPFLERLDAIIPSPSLRDVRESFCRAKLPAFRANTLKISGPELKKRLTALRIRVQAIDWYRDAFLLEEPSQREFEGTELYEQGCVYIQNPSSMIPPLVLRPEPGETVLDIAAAPGSKTTQVAALMQNTGHILANDTSRIRLYKLGANLRLQGVTNTTLSNVSGQGLWKRHPERFDRTLVDVPCSLEGLIQCDFPRTYQNWSVKKIHTLSRLQRYLLRSAVSATKVGGIIVYSTCTLAPEENEGVIDWILRKEAGRLEIEEVGLKVPRSLAGLTRWDDKTFDQGVRQCVRILPSDVMEAFFVARLRKTASTVPALDESEDAT
ncbi:MAG: RsmB/NOP family class I SAM-dependent RNA methyltransferase [Planctomycetota bacterium]